MQHRGLHHVNAEDKDETSQHHDSPVQQGGDNRHHPPGKIGGSNLNLEVIALAEILVHPHRSAAMKHGMADE